MSNLFSCFKKKKKKQNEEMKKKEETIDEKITLKPPREENKLQMIAKPAPAGRVARGPEAPDQEHILTVRLPIQGRLDSTDVNATVRISIESPSVRNGSDGGERSDKSTSGNGREPNRLCPSAAEFVPRAPIRRKSGRAEESGRTAESGRPAHVPRGDVNAVSTLAPRRISYRSRSRFPSRRPIAARPDCAIRNILTRDAHPVTRLNMISMLTNHPMEFRVVDVYGPMHRPTFKMFGIINGFIGYGSGSSKKMAKYMAAIRIIHQIYVHISAPRSDDDDYC